MNAMNTMVPKLIGRLQELLRHAHLNIAVPVLVAAGLLSYVASLASTPQAARELVVIAQHVWWIVLVLILPYLALRLYVWHDLLRLLNLNVPFRRLLVAFAAGEMTKSLPAGIYVENYLLRRLAHQGEEKTVRSTVTTTAILGLEAALALVVILVGGIPGAPWVRWGLGVLVGAWLGLIAALWLLVRREVDKRSTLPGWLRHAVTDAAHFLEEGAALLQWRTLKNFGPTALYMGIYAVALGFILQVLGYHLAWYAIITVYASMVLVVVLIPIPTEIGVAEIGALGALESFGVPHHRAALVTLALRLLATGATIVVAGGVFLALRGEIKEAEQEADSHDASCAQGAHEPASTAEQAKGHAAD